MGSLGEGVLLVHHLASNPCYWLQAYTSPTDSGSMLSLYGHTLQQRQLTPDTFRKLWQLLLWHEARLILVSKGQKLWTTSPEKSL